MINWIVIGVLALVIGAIVFYLWRERKRGNRCIGCPYAKQCARKERHCPSQDQKDT